MNLRKFKMGLCFVIMCMLLTVTGCTSSGLNTTKKINSIVSISEVSSFAEVTKAKELIAVNVSSTEIMEVYKIGEVSQFFVGLVGMPQYNSGNGDKITVSKTFGTDLIRSKTLSSICSITESKELEIGTADYLPIKIGVGYSYSKMSSHEVNEYEAAENTMSESWERQLDFDRYESGFWYAVGLFRDMDVFQTIIFDLDGKTIKQTNIHYGAKNDFPAGVRIIKSDDEKMNFSFDNITKIEMIEEFDEDDFTECLQNQLYKDEEVFSISTSKWNSGGRGTDWSNWINIENLSSAMENKYNISALKYLYNNMRIRYKYTTEVFGSIEYKFRIYNVTKDKYLALSNIIYIENGEGKKEKEMIFENINLNDISPNDEILLQVSWHKNNLFWGGEFSIYQERKIYTLPNNN